MRPSAHEARRHVLQLRELDLQLAFVRARALREDVENQPRAIDDAALGEFFEIALLHRRERAVDQDQVRVERLPLQGELLGLAGADEVARVRPVDARGQRADDARARRACKLAKLIESDRVGAARLLRLQEQRAFAFSGSFEQRDLLVMLGRLGRHGRGAAGTGFGADADIACRYDRRYRVLVNHLADGIAEQHDELVERLHRTLQFDAVDEVDRHRHALTPQRIQKWILQRLPLGHGLLLHQQIPEPAKNDAAQAAPGRPGSTVSLISGIPDSVESS
jgi:hypothetical protein